MLNTLLRLIFNTNNVNYLTILLNTLATLVSVKFMGLQLDSYEYSQIIGFSGLVGLLCFPANIVATKLQSYLLNPAYYKNEFSSLFQVLILIVFIVFLGINIFSIIGRNTYLLYGSIIGVCVFLWNISQFMFDAEALIRSKFKVTLISLIAAIGTLIIIKNILFTYLIFLIVRLILSLYRIWTYFEIRKSKVNFKHFNKLGQNSLYSFSQMFGDNGLRFFTSVYMNPDFYVIFDIHLRIIYSIRGLVGQMQLKTIIQNVRSDNSLLDKEYLRNFSFLVFVTLIAIILSWTFYWKILEPQFHIIIPIVFFIGLVINIFISPKFNWLLKTEKFYSLSLLTISIPILIINFEFLVKINLISIPLAFILQTIMTAIIYFKIRQ